MLPQWIAELTSCVEDPRSHVVELQGISQGNRLPQTTTLVQKVVQTCQFVDTIKYIQPTQNTSLIP